MSYRPKTLSRTPPLLLSLKNVKNKALPCHQATYEKCGNLRVFNAVCKWMGSIICRHCDGEDKGTIRPKSHDLGSVRTLVTMLCYRTRRFTIIIYAWWL